MKVTIELNDGWTLIVADSDDGEDNGVSLTLMDYGHFEHATYIPEAAIPVLIEALRLHVPTTNE